MPSYVYAITPADHPLRLDGVAGIGRPATPLRTVATRDLAAVVSEAPAALRAKRRDLAAHQEVLTRLMEDGAVLPMRFGLVGPDDEQVRKVLEEQRDRYLDRLAELDGCVEYNLKVSRQEEDLLRQILTESPEARRLNERTKADPGARDEMVALGELVAREARVREEDIGRRIVDRLSPQARRAATAEPTSQHFLNVSFMVERRRADAFTRSVHQEAARHGDAFTFTLHGPLPLYSFV
jgi:hypothetical protein